MFGHFVRVSSKRVLHRNTKKKKLAYLLGAQNQAVVTNLQHSCKLPKHTCPHTPITNLDSKKALESQTCFEGWGSFPG